MADPIFGITGLPRPGNAPTKTKEIPYAPNMPARMEISTFAGLAASKNEDMRRQWTLFVLGLEKFKNMSVDKKLSYFQVAGIHSYPRQPWDSAPPGAHDGDYCFHSKLNFGPWHRPYMLLFEQCIWENMRAVVTEWEKKSNGQFKDSEIWFDAADQWRLPYWDWARHQTYAEDFAYPKAFTTPSVRIYPPAEVASLYPLTREYPNPLWSFENPEKNEDDDPLPFGQMPGNKDKWNINDSPQDDDPKQLNKIENWFPWSRCTNTSRYGVFLNKSKQGWIGLDGINNFTEANKHLAAARILTAKDPDNPKNQDKSPNYISPENGNLADSVNRMFTPKYNKSWKEFATTQYTQDSTTGRMSLEHIHNQLHLLSGGSSYEFGVGHMSDVPVAAFDPIFWFHHCQVDRLLSIWQCLYPKLWFDDGGPDGDNETTLLQPFHTVSGGSPKTDVYTAKKCFDWTNLHYQYDDLLALSDKATLDDGTLNEPLFQEKLHKYVDATYPSVAKAVFKAQELKQVPEGLLSPSEPEKTTWNDYIINVNYDRYALNGKSYTIEFYLGGPEGDQITNFKHKNFVGRIYNFAGSDITGCANCKQQAENGVMSCGQVPLTIHLWHHAKDDVEDHPIDDFTDIKEYLRLHLQWRYLGPGGGVLDPKRFPKTEVKVFKGVGEVREAAKAPKLPPPEQLIGGSQESKDALSFSALQAIIGEAPPTAVSALYYDYEELTIVTDGKEGLDSRIPQTA